ncbi:MAG: hypothetical protein ACT4OF_15905 [Caulobacteraceae bacterium]
MDEMLHLAAQFEAQTITDVVMSVCREGLPLRVQKVDPRVRQMAFEACSNVSKAMNSLLADLDRAEGPELTEAMQIVLMRDLMKSMINKAADRLLTPSQAAMTAHSHWALAQNDIDELGLNGPAWDQIRSIGPTSPPPTDVQMEALAEALGVAMRRARDAQRKSKLETLNVLLGVAKQLHDEEWVEIRQQAEQDVRKLLTGREG